MSSYQIEALLRPNSESWSAFFAFAFGGTLIAIPYHFFPVSIVGLPLGSLLILYGMSRARTAWRLHRYQRNLAVLPRYRMPLSEVPVSNRTLFIGMGFVWSQQHVQRLYDLMDPQRKIFVRTPKLPRITDWAMTHWENTHGLRQVASLLATDSALNPFRPMPPTFGEPALHGVGSWEGDQRMSYPLSERVGHTIVLGTTRVGKTRLAQLLIEQDIRRGDIVIVFDPKGDAELLAGMYAAAKRAGRLDYFTVFHLAHPDHSARYNGIGNFSRMTEIATRIANQLPHQGSAAAFKEFSWRFLNICAQAEYGLGNRTTLLDLRRDLNDIEPLVKRYLIMWLPKKDNNWKQRLDRIERLLLTKDNGVTLSPPERQRSRDVVYLTRAAQEIMSEEDHYDAIVDGLLSAFKLDKTYFDKITSSIGPLLEKLNTGRVAELISPDYFDTTDPRPILDWRTVIRQGGIVYVGLAALTDSMVAGAVGNTMFADLTSTAGELYDYGHGQGLPDALMTTAKEAATKKKICLHCDEFNELIGPEFIPMVNKAGGAGFQVTAYTQVGADVEAKLGNRPMTEQVFGNFNTEIYLRVKDDNTAFMLTSKVKNVMIHQRMRVSGIHQSADPSSRVEFTSSTQERLAGQQVPEIEPWMVKNLPKGQAFALIKGGELVKIRIPEPVTDEDADLPSSLAGIVDEMRRNYESRDASDGPIYRDEWTLMGSPDQKERKQAERDKKESNLAGAEAETSAWYAGDTHTDMDGFDGMGSD